MGSRRQQQSQITYPDPTENNEALLRMFQRTNRQQSRRLRGMFRNFNRSTRDTLSGLRQTQRDVETASAQQAYLNERSFFSSILDRMNNQAVLRTQRALQERNTSQAMNAQQDAAGLVEEKRQSFLAQLLRSRR